MVVLRLPDVTLVAIETREHELALLALEDCEARADFGDVLVFTDKPSMFMRGNRRVITVDDWPSKLGWSQCFWYEVPLHVRTSHILGIQWDSWVVDPRMWRDEYLRYDFIGAPWWYKDGLNVGNGGFSLRSTKFARFVRAHRAEFPCTTPLDDDLYCRKYRLRLQEAGFEWAPEPLAFDFAFECVRPDPQSRHFGFHATFNFDYGCQNDQTRLAERGKIMARSDYIRGGAMWKNFEAKFPQLVGQLREARDG